MVIPKNLFKQIIKYSNKSENRKVDSTPYFLIFRIAANRPNLNISGEFFHCFNNGSETVQYVKKVKNHTFLLLLA